MLVPTLRPSSKGFVLLSKRGMFTRYIIFNQRETTAKETFIIKHHTFLFGKQCRLSMQEINAGYKSSAEKVLEVIN